jgi:hypothetical protein
MAQRIQRLLREPREPGRLGGILARRSAPLLLPVDVPGREPGELEVPELHGGSVGAPEEPVKGTHHLKISVTEDRVVNQKSRLPQPPRRRP